ncbi:MAG: DUF5106 domain-containing protein [Cyclobacteriaceae bacterium]|nr:DUF5106 domain-containing protein [Cyclobacteriaceae bacterium]
MKIFFVSVLLSLCVAPIVGNSQDSAYSLDFQISGWADTTVYLGYYYGESTYIKDTASVNSNGSFTFDGDTQLPKGVYFLVMNTTKIFELLVGDDQHFSITTDDQNYIKNIIVEGDTNNQLFFKNIHFIGEKNQRAQEFVTVLKDSMATEQQKNEAKKNLTIIGNEVKTYHNDIIASNSTSTVATILKSQRKIEIPEAIADDQNKRFSYFRSHFWDDFDLGNEMLLRIPEGLYRKKIDNYMDNLNMQIPDSLIIAIDKIVNQAKNNQETYKYTVWNLCLKYQTPKIMGLDEVFVYLYDQFFETGEMDYWANESLKKNLKERADQLRKSMVGKTAANMILLNDKLQRVSLYDIKNKYTIIYFYDPDCGHCKKETPKLNDFYKTTKFDVEVFAVSADTSMVKMQNYIKENHLEWISANGPRTVTPHYQSMYDANTTPSIYILDEKKKIIAKKFPDSSKIEAFLDNYEKYNKE